MAKNQKTSKTIEIDADIFEKGEKLAKANGFKTYDDLILFWTVQCFRGKLTIDPQFVDFQDVLHDRYDFFEDINKEKEEIEF